MNNDNNFEFALVRSVLLVKQGKYARNTGKLSCIVKKHFSAEAYIPCEQSPLVFLLGTAQRSERDSAELVYKFI